MRQRATSFLILLAVPLAACAPRIDDPGSIEGVKAMTAAYVTAVNAGDADAATAVFAEEGLYAMPNLAPARGREAIRAAHQAWFGQFKNEFTVEATDVRVTGDRAIARGTWTNTMTPTAGSGAVDTDSGSWGALYQRQSDGSWAWVWVVPNSDRPEQGATADGAEEQAILKIEEEWGQAELNKDGAVLDRILAPEYVANIGGQVMTRAQYIAQATSRDLTVESATTSNLRALVFGDRAFVSGNYSLKATTRGKDSSMSIWFAEVFAKRDGRWQVLSTTGVSTPMP